MMEIVTGADTKILRTVCAPIKNFDEKLEQTAENMIDTMLGDQEGGSVGIGLAANQVGLDMRMMLTTFNMKSPKNQKVIVMINPEVLEFSDHEVEMEEGCLSLPNIFGKVTRPKKIKVKWQNLKGNWCEKKLDGWDARIFLHELDHLDGKMFTDYL